MKLSTKVLKEQQDELIRVLKDTVPGLVQGSSESAVQATLSAVGSDDRLLGPGQHHRLLIHPDAFHVSVLFQPTLAFMDRVSNIFPFGHETSRAASVLLDDFVLNVYLPQLEDKVSDIFHHAVTSK
jgi:exocyst complex component 4